MARKRRRNEQTGSLECGICGERVVGDHSSLARHIRHSRDHEDIYDPRPEKPPSYADPQFDNTNSRSHDPEWDQSRSPLYGGSNFGGDYGQQDLEEGPEDVMFEGAGRPPSNQKG